MPIKVTCPSCGAGGSISLFIADADARNAIAEAAKLPGDCGALVIKYIAMFAPSKRHLTMDRAARLIGECCAMIVEGADFDRLHIEAPSHVWRRALIQVLDAPGLTRPLRNHHYLLRVVQSLLVKRDDAAQAERHRQRRHAPHVRDDSMRPVGDVIAGDAEQSPDPLEKLDKKQQETLAKTARQSLIEDGFKPGFIVQPLIEQRMRELLAQEESHAENR